MKKRTIVIILAVIVILTPYLGLPGSWEDTLNLILGAGIIVTVAVRKRSGSKIVDTMSTTVSSEPLSAKEYSRESK